MAAQRAADSRPGAARPIGWRRFAPHVAGVVALVGFVVAGSSVYRACRGPAWSEPGVQLPSDLPVRDVRRLGHQVVATLGDPAWLEQPVAERSRQLRQAFELLASHQIDSLVILDDHGIARASVQSVNGEARVGFF